MNKLKSLVLSLSYNGIAFVFIYILIIFGCSGAAELFSLPSTQVQIYTIQQGLLVSIWNIITFVVMIYPILNFLMDVYGIFKEEIHKFVSWIIGNIIAFVCGGINELSKRKKDAL